MKKIIIAEDIQATLNKEDCFLNRSGIRIFSTRTNKEAFDIHKNEKADLIIAKVDTPEMKGERLCSLIRNEHELCNVSIIIVCADSETDIERCAYCSANQNVPGPLVLLPGDAVADALAKAASLAAAYSDAPPGTPLTVLINGGPGNTALNLTTPGKEELKLWLI